ncbi:hypothetical protein OC835_007309 [Tilletia horrida]|nr:hypothetical protein OC835_007309 [Tilletia horrida]
MKTTALFAAFALLAATARASTYDPISDLTARSLNKLAGNILLVRADDLAVAIRPPVRRAQKGPDPDEGVLFTRALIDGLVQQRRAEAAAVLQGRGLGCLLGACAGGKPHGAACKPESPSSSSGSGSFPYHHTEDPKRPPTQYYFSKQLSSIPEGEHEGKDGEEFRSSGKGLSNLGGKATTTLRQSSSGKGRSGSASPRH